VTAAPGPAPTVTVTAAPSASAAPAPTVTVTAAPPAKTVFAAQPVPKITGKAKVGAKLKAKASGWEAGATTAYQWYAGAKKIKGATKSTLKVKSAWVGKTIRVKVTVKKDGYQTAVKTSAKTAKVKK
jgi:hypothetical protein